MLRVTTRLVPDVVLLIEVVAVGTAVRRMAGIATHSAALPVQAVVRDDDSLSISSGGSAGFATSLAFGAGIERSIQRRANPAGCVIVFITVLIFLVVAAIVILGSVAQH